jgi:hypothetical protein
MADLTKKDEPKTGESTKTESDKPESTKKLSKSEKDKLVSDVIRRYTSDTQSYEKCMSELAPLIE